MESPTRDNDLERWRDKAVADERAACAELVRAVGCTSEIAAWSIDVPGDMARLEAGQHFDGACPHALAAAIEARGRA